MSELGSRIDQLSPEKRRLLELRLKKAGLQRRDTVADGKIPRLGGAGPHPLSWGQQRLWFIDRLAPASPAYNIPFAGRLHGPLDAKTLQKALAEIVRRQEILRTRFVDVGGEPRQVIDSEARVSMPLIDLRALDGERREAELERLLTLHPARLFDLARGPSWRVHLARLGEKDHALLVCMHHILTDAWSMAVFFRELPALYDAFAAGRPSPLPALPIQVADHARWQRERLSGQRLDKDLAFWKDHLEGAPTLLDLPFDRPRPAEQTMRGRRAPIRIPQDLVDRLRRENERRGTTMFMALLAAFTAMLHHLTGQDDILLGSPFATREPEETHGLIGFFINIAVLRTRLVDPDGGGGARSFGKLLEHTRESTFATLAHQEMPFERIVERLDVGRDLAVPPLVQAYIVLQNVHIPRPDFEQIEVPSVQQTDTRAARVDLTLGLWEEEGLEGWWEYNVDLFDRSTVLRMGHTLTTLLRSALDAMDRPLDTLDALGPAARHQLLREWNDTERPAAAPVVERIRQLAGSTPNAPAVVFRGRGGAGREELSYAELARRAATRAGELRAAGVGGGSLVPIELERGVEWVESIVGAWWAGAAYLPIDPGLPEARRRWMLEDVGGDGEHDGAKAPCYERKPAKAGWDSALSPIYGALTHSTGLQPRHAAAVTPRSSLLPQDAAYVIYTSGSTGRPKGTVLRQPGLANLGRALVRRFDVRPGDVVVQFAALGFDGVMAEFAAAFYGGATLLLTEREVLRSPPDLAELVAAEGATHLVLPPSAAAVLEPETLPSVRVLVMVGEAASAEVAGRWTRAGRRVVNGYGPTETTVATAIGAIEPGCPGRPSIGRPLDNLRVRILGRGGRLVPVGAAGELVVGGVGLATGYLGRAGLTAERFVPDALGESPGERLYRTGDRARWLGDGRLDFLGRLDAQVKIRGHRIEPGEIEAVLGEDEAVREVAVVVCRGARPSLAAFGVLDSAAAEEVLERLRRRLPEYLVPSRFEVVDALPRSAAGKIDRLALVERASEVSRVVADAAFTAPRGVVEETLARIWSEVLGVEKVGATDDFFRLGGDSILGMQVLSRAADAGYRLDPRQVFTHPTLEAMAGAAAATAVAAIEPLVGEVPMLPTQRWFFELEASDDWTSHWNMSLALAVDSLPELAALSAAAAALARRHDALRARFVRGADGWRQEIAPPDAVDGASLARRVEVAEAAGVELVARELAAELDLEAGALWRVAAIGLASGGGRLVLIAHHLVVDAVSWRILLEDLETALASAAADPDGPIELPSPSATVGDWAAHLEAWAHSEAAVAALTEWREPAVEPLPRDLDDVPGAGVEKDAEFLETALDAELSTALAREAGEAYGARLEEIVLAALAEAVCRWTGERRVVLDVERHGRDPLLGGDGLEHDSMELDGPDPSRLVGWLTAFHPLALESADADPGARLLAVKERSRAAARRGAAYVALRYLGSPEARRALAEAPPREISLNHLGRVDALLAAGARLADEPLGPLRAEDAPRPHLLEIVTWVGEGSLRSRWTWNRRVHHRSTVEGLAQSFEDALVALLEHCRNPEAGGFSPSDFPDADLDQDALDALMSQLGD